MPLDLGASSILPERQLPVMHWPSFVSLDSLEQVAYHSQERFLNDVY